jgi:hypothetical protein
VASHFFLGDNGVVAVHFSSLDSERERDSILLEEILSGCRFDGGFGRISTESP